MGEFKAMMEGGEPMMNEYLFDETLLSTDELRVLTFESYTREWADLYIVC